MIESFFDQQKGVSKASTELAMEMFYRFGTRTFNNLQEPIPSYYTNELCKLPPYYRGSDEYILIGLELYYRHGIVEFETEVRLVHNLLPTDIQLNVQWSALLIASTRNVRQWAGTWAKKESLLLLAQKHQFASGSAMHDGLCAHFDTSRLVIKTLCEVSSVICSFLYDYDIQDVARAYEVFPDLKEAFSDSKIRVDLQLKRYWNVSKYSVSERVLLRTLVKRSLGKFHNSTCGSSTVKNEMKVIGIEARRKVFVDKVGCGTYKQLHDFEPNFIDAFTNNTTPLDIKGKNKKYNTQDGNIFPQPHLTMGSEDNVECGG